MKKPAQKPRFIKPPNILKQKVGSGGIDEKLIEKSQNFIETVELDFAPYAHQFLEEMQNQITRAAQGVYSFEIMREQLVVPVMQLKANGGMFRYALVSDVADIAMQFLDAITEINADVIEVLKANYNTLSVIMKNKLKGTGGSEGTALIEELNRATRRYFEKYQS